MRKKSYKRAVDPHGNSPSYFRLFPTGKKNTASILPHAISPLVCSNIVTCTGSHLMEKYSTPRTLAIKRSRNERVRRGMAFWVWSRTGRMFIDVQAYKILAKWRLTGPRLDRAQKDKCSLKVRPTQRFRFPSLNFTCKVLPFSQQTSASEWYISERSLRWKFVILSYRNYDNNVEIRTLVE